MLIVDTITNKQSPSKLMMWSHERVYVRTCQSVSATYATRHYRGSSALWWYSFVVFRCIRFTHFTFTRFVVDIESRSMGTSVRRRRAGDILHDLAVQAVPTQLEVTDWK